MGSTTIYPEGETCDPDRMLPVETQHIQWASNKQQSDELRDNSPVDRQAFPNRIGPIRLSGRRGNNSRLVATRKLVTPAAHTKQLVGTARASF